MKGSYLRFPILALCVTIIVALALGCAPTVLPTEGPTATPAPKPPAAAPTKPAVLPTEGPTKPAVEPAKPAAEPSKPTAVPTKPAAATPAPKAAEKPSQPATVKYGSLGTIADAPFYIALDKGYFKEQGLTIDEVKFDSGARMIAPLAAGQLEMGGGAISAGLINAIARDIPLKIVADRGRTSVGNGYQAFVIRKDLVDSGQFKDATSLKGKTLALPALGISPHVEVGMLMDGVKMSMDDVRLVEVPFPDMNAAFAGKSIDAALHVEPFLTRGLEQGLFIRWKGSDEVYPDHQISIMMYGPKFIADNADAGRGWMVAWLKAIRDYNDAFIKKDRKARDEVIPILVKYTTLKEAAMWEKIVPQGVNPDGYVNVKSIEYDQEWFVKQGLVQKKVDVNGIIDNQFVDYALSKVGKYR